MWCSLSPLLGGTAVMVAWVDRDTNSTSSGPRCGLPPFCSATCSENSQHKDYLVSDSVPLLRITACTPAWVRAHAHTRTHIRTRVHTHTHIHTHAHTHTPAWVRTHTRTHTQIHTHTCMGACTRTHAHTHTRIRTRSHTYTHTRTHTQIHTHTHTHTRTHTHLHGCAHIHAHTRTHTPGTNLCFALISLISQCVTHPCMFGLGQLCAPWPTFLIPFLSASCSPWQATPNFPPIFSSLPPFPDISHTTVGTHMHEPDSSFSFNPLYYSYNTWDLFGTPALLRRNTAMGQK
jgi:hypothetical protein